MNKLLNNDTIDYLKEAIIKPDLELEFVYGTQYLTKLNRSQFIEISKHLLNNYFHLETINDLDISTSSDEKGESKFNEYRISIHGLDEIKKYCKSDSLQGIKQISYLEKKPYKTENLKKTKIIDNNYNYTINLKTETKLRKDNYNIKSILENWKSLNKLFRYKRRYTYLSESNLFKIDLTVVKTNKYNRVLKTYDLFKSFKDADILNNDETYELEVEYIGNTILSDKKKESSEIIDELNIYKFINNVKKGIVTNDYNSYIYDPLFLKYSDQVDMAYSKIQFGFNSLDEDNITGKYCTINKSYWDKVKDPELKDVFDKNNTTVYILNVLKNYKGDFGIDDYVYVQFIPSLNIGEKYIVNRTIPLIDVNIEYFENEFEIDEDRYAPPELDDYEFSGGANSDEESSDEESSDEESSDEESPQCPSAYWAKYGVKGDGGPQCAPKYSEKQKDILNKVIQQLKEKYKNMDEYELFIEIFEVLLREPDSDEEKKIIINQDDYKTLIEEFSTWNYEYNYDQRQRTFYKFIKFKQKRRTGFDYSTIPRPEEIKSITFMEETWVPQLSNIIYHTYYKMPRKPEKGSINEYQLRILDKFVELNKVIMISKDDRYALKLGTISEIEPILIYDKKIKTYLFNYKVLNRSDEENIQESLEVIIDTTPTLIQSILNILNNTVYDLYKVIQNTELPLSINDKKRILVNYSILVKANYKKNIFMGPQPITLTKDHLNIENPASIINNYVVTEKADGYRYLLYIDESSKEGYLISSKKEKYYDTNSRKLSSMLTIKRTGIIFNNVKGAWLLDGEYIDKDKLGNSLQLFMIFDVYYATNEYPSEPYTYPFISNDISRYSILDDFKTSILSSLEYLDVKNKLEIHIKSYEKGLLNIVDKSSPLNDLIFIKSKKILDKNSENNDVEGFIYNIDGLIYLPANLPVGSDLCGNPPEFINGTWNLNYKYKPPEENTIDFKITTEKNRGKTTVDKINIKTIVNSDNTQINVKTKTLLLHVGYDQINDLELDYSMLSLLNKPYNKKTQQLFKPHGVDNVSRTSVILDNNKMICLKDKREIQDNDIVEMLYNYDSTIGDIWIPLRIRDDKNKPQYFETANKIWNTIKNPITDSMIMGEIDYRNMPAIVKDEYYDNELNNSCSISLRKFHNYLKLKLIQYVGLLNNTNQILDTSIGRGGDIDKYMNKKMKTSFILGMDLYPVNEACRRLYFSNSEKIPVVLLRYDTSKNIKNDSGLTGTDDEKYHSKIMLGILNNTIHNVPSKYRSISMKYKDKINSKFNLISCQFSLHYYFENEIKLREYLENISENCISEGYFIGTCYDGSRVFNDLKMNNKIEYFDKFKNKIYTIEKKYQIDNFDYNQSDTSNMLGNRIDVYMDSIGYETPEYLVNFDYLIDLMKEYKFKLVQLPTSSIFDKPIGGFREIIDMLPQLYGKDQLLKDNVMDILNDEKLMELSSYNNYFIFQKEGSTGV